MSQIISTSLPRPPRVVKITDRFMKKKRDTLTASDSSEGVLYALFLAVLLLSEKGPRFFAVDNIDQTLNPRLIQRLMEILCEWFIDFVPQKQMICTAHNPAVLDGLKIGDDSFRLFAVDRNSDGLTVIQRVNLTQELLDISKEKNMPLSRLWVEGYIGGVPNV